MDLYHSRLTQDDLKELIIKYKIPCDLHPWLPSEEFVMFELSDNDIGMYHRILDFSGVRIPFSSFLIALVKHYKVHFSQLGPLGLKKVVILRWWMRSSEEEFNLITYIKELFLGEDVTRAIPNMGFNLVNVEVVWLSLLVDRGVCVEFGCHFEVELECELTLSSLDVLQGFSFFLQMGFTLILATLDGLDVGLLGDVIGEDDCDDDG
ncbi:hypothetical protein Tco_0090247 [Tanacetum coccineum]